GVDSAWEQKKLEARKMLENAAESHTSGARFVGQFFVMQDLLIEIKHITNKTTRNYFDGTKKQCSISLRLDRIT
ncbi:MAG: hypothetical protein IPP55_15555, partial [Anaerolineales bacterium]|nr:hypothetical protein [Anaerolineales bacterium]